MKFFNSLLSVLRLFLLWDSHFEYERKEWISYLKRVSKDIQDIIYSNECYSKCGLWGKTMEEHRFINSEKIENFINQILKIV